MSIISYLIFTALLGLALGGASAAMTRRRQVVYAISKPRIRPGRLNSNSRR
jgi:hypothetical protein